MEANFTIPEMVSIYSEPDRLKLEIKRPDLFISIENGLSLEGKTKFTHPIRLQLEPPAN